MSKIKYGRKPWIQDTELIKCMISSLKCDICVLNHDRQCLLLTSSVNFSCTKINSNIPWLTFIASEIKGIMELRHVDTSHCDYFTEAKGINFSTRWNYRFSFYRFIKLILLTGSLWNWFVIYSQDHHINIITFFNCLIIQLWLFFCT